MDRAGVRVVSSADRQGVLFSAFVDVRPNWDPHGLHHAPECVDVQAPDDPVSVGFSLWEYHQFLLALIASVAHEVPAMISKLINDAIEKTKIIEWFVFVFFHIENNQQILNEIEHNNYTYKE